MNERKPRRITHVIAPAPFGGLERVVHTLAVAQRNVGHDVRVAALVDDAAPEPDIVSRLRNDDVKVLLCKTAAHARRAQLRILRAACAEGMPQVVHSHGALADVFTGFALRGRVARVSTAHGFTGGDLKNRFYEWLQCRALTRFDRVVAVSQKLRDDLQRAGIPSTRIAVVVNAWMNTGALPRAEARDRLGILSDVFSIGWVGRLSYEKGPDVMIDALTFLSDLPWRLSVVGDGPQRAALENRAVLAGLAHRITWYGSVPDAPRLTRAFDVLVISSRTEGTPMTLLEAMGAEVPIATTSVGGIPDVISPNDGLLVPPENPRALAEAIQAIHFDPQSARQRSVRAAARLANERSIDRWVSEYDSVYAAAIGKRA